jgi:hypothetical protein
MIYWSCVLLAGSLNRVANGLNKLVHGLNSLSLTLLRIASDRA